MKRLLFFHLLFFTTVSLIAQFPGNANDWVEYDKTYYRFTINEDGIYRLTTTDLIAAGISESDLVGDHFKMIQNGKEVPLYVTTSGAFGSNDYIEFLGKKNTGETDTGLYSSPVQQPGTSRSLFSDESIHFLTIDSSEDHARITDLENDLTNLPEKENFYMAEVLNTEGGRRNGKHYRLSSFNLYFSDFEDCEGLNIFLLRNNRTKQFDFGTDHIYQTDEVPVTVDFKVASFVHNNNTSPGNINVSIGNSDTETINIPGLFAFTEHQSTFSTSNLTNSRFRINNQSGATLYIPEKKLTYPRTFDFTDQSFSYVNVNRPGSRYVELENLSSLGGDVIVYDLSSNQRITETITSSTPIRTGQASLSNRLVFDTQIGTPTFVSSTNFNNYVDSEHELIVIYHSALEEPIEGENYVQKFIDHKSSETGGGWNTLKVDIQQIIDQFAYGVRGHSGAIKNFVAELKQNDNLPGYILLIGKGYEYQITLSEELDDDYIPTYGFPGSDSQLVADYGESNLNCAIGRISARNTQELKHYVDKVIEYQTLMLQTDDMFQTKDKLWMKNAMHLGGGGNAGEQAAFRNILNNYKSVYEAPQYGGHVTSFFKNSTDPIQNIDIASLDSLINSGLSMINYFGHSSVNHLEFNLNDFSQYNQEGKYPFMLTNGCFVGDLFQTRKSLGEDFVLVEDAGTLSFMGPSQLGIAGGMNAFCNKFYDLFIVSDYGIPIGQAILNSHNDLNSNNQIRILTKQQLIFHGDPTLSIYKHDKPDYLITEEDLIFEPNVLSIDVDEFTVHAVISNIGKAQNEPVSVTMTRTFPNGEQESQTLSLDHVYYQDTISFTFQTNPLLAEGINQFNLQIDPQDELDEITRANNNLVNAVNRPIINDAVKPILPAEFAITNNSETELIAYTSRFTIEPQNFEMQIDTTELFNSPVLQSQSISSTGGTLKWQPNISYEDEQVYYWRVRKQTDDSEWFSSSFVYLNNYTEGWNQSHYFQYVKDDYNKFFINDDRQFEFGNNQIQLNVRTAIFPRIPHSQTAFSIDGVVQANKRCLRDIGIVVIDEISGLPWENERVSGGVGLYNSIYCNRPNSQKIFFFDVDTPENRGNFISMIDAIDDGKYVLVFSLDALNPLEYDWASSNDIRETLQENGADQAFSINENAPYVYFFQKGNSNFSEQAEFVGQDDQEVIDENFTLPVKFSEGSLTSTLIGPAASWNNFLWSWDNSYDNIPEGDKITYSIIGVNTDGEETVIASQLDDPNYDLSNINASTYPYLKIKVDFEDDSYYTPAQLQYIRVVYETLPEMAIDVSSIIQSGELNFNQNESVSLSYRLDNIYTKDMSPVLVEYTYSQAAGGQESVEERYEELPAGQSQTIEFDLNTVSDNLVGENLLYIDANPNDDQPEQFHFNNIALIEFALDKDNENPFLDVTFDGIRIIDGDLVSDTPEILISVTDENEYLLLNDPEDFEITVTFPNEDQVTYQASSPEITFYPANNLEDNSAKIEFSPQFEPGIYEMRVQATDRSNNQAGENDYIITFEVTDEDVITQIINYPNPFTTSTEFIARIIGEAPDEVLIQIFSPSGQVVRELHSYAGDITLSQGNNYYSVAHWDGTDEFGDPIGNGVYFYKISMKRNGELIEAYDSENYSEYFHNGIGKLYILR